MLCLLDGHAFLPVNEPHTTQNQHKTSKVNTGKQSRITPYIVITEVSSEDLNSLGQLKSLLNKCFSQEKHRKCSRNAKK